MPAYRAMAQAFDSRTSATDGVAAVPGAGTIRSPGTATPRPPALPGSPRWTRIPTAPGTASDAPYAPYYPGDDAVDWAGLTTHHDDTGGKAAVNTLPGDGELVSLLTGTARGAAAVGGGGGASDGGGDANFYAVLLPSSGTSRCCSRRPRYYSPSAGGPSEADIKSGWWKQVLGAAVPRQTGADCRRRLGRENRTPGTPATPSLTGDSPGTPPWPLLPARPSGNPRSLPGRSPGQSRVWAAQSRQRAGRRSGGDRGSRAAARSDPAVAGAGAPALSQAAGRTRTSPRAIPGWT